MTPYLLFKGNPIGVAKALDMAFSATCPSQMICFPHTPTLPHPPPANPIVLSLLLCHPARLA